MKYDLRRHHRRSIRLKGYDYAQAGAYFVTICAQGRECLFGQVANNEMRLNDAGRMVQAVWDALPTRFPTIELDEWMIMPNHCHGIIVIGDSTVGASLVDARDMDARDMDARDMDARDMDARDMDARDMDARDMDARDADARDADARDADARDADARDADAPDMDAPDADIPDRAGTRPAPTEATPSITINRHPKLGEVVGAFKSISTDEYIVGVKTFGWPPFRNKVWQRNYYEHIIRNEHELGAIRQYIQNNPLKWELDRDNPVNRCPEAKTVDDYLREAGV